MDRRYEITDLLDQIQAALYNVKREWKEQNETEALLFFVHSLSLLVTTLDELLQHVKHKATDPEKLEMLEAKRELLQRKGEDLIQQMQEVLKHINR